MFNSARDASWVLTPSVGGFTAWCIEDPGCSWEAPTPQAALEGALVALQEGIDAGDITMPLPPREPAESDEGVKLRVILRMVRVGLEILYSGCKNPVALARDISDAAQHEIDLSILAGL